MNSLKDTPYSQAYFFVYNLTNLKNSLIFDAQEIKAIPSV